MKIFITQHGVHTSLIDKIFLNKQSALDYAFERIKNDPYFKSNNYPLERLKEIAENDVLEMETED